MLNEPLMESLTQKHRQKLFWLLFIVFLITLPTLIFYTTGYRLTFDNEQTAIVTTGGMYISTGNNLEVMVYLDEELVKEPRLFRSAYYIQNVESGQHKVVVQRPDLQTWVKELPVDSRIVIEASAFNIPLVPHIRPITEYITNNGLPVFFSKSTSTNFFPKATTTIPIVIETSSKARIGQQLSEEYIFVKSLFDNRSTSSESTFTRILDGVERFRFATTSLSVSSSATSTMVVENGDMRIVEKEDDLFAVWQGSINTIPYYFCIPENNSSTTAIRYGEHVAVAIEQHLESTSSPMIIDQNRLCRPEIKINRKRQGVYYYNFFPDSADLLLLQLEDGLYVTEIDDRAWQNIQLLYPGNDFRVVVEGGSIFIKENDLYFEVVTEIEPN